MKNIKSALFALLVTFYSLVASATNVAELETYLLSVEQEIEQIKQASSEVTSSLSQSMLIHQIETLTTQSNLAVIEFAQSQATASQKKDALRLIRFQEQIVDNQLTNATKAISTLFKNFETVSIDEQPIQWVTVANGLNYRTRLLELKLALLNTHKVLGTDVDTVQKAFKDSLETISSNLYIVLSSSLKLSEVLQNERTNTPADQRSGIDTRLRMQQRMNQTFSDNLKDLLPLMEATSIDTTKYNEITFSATGELSDAIVSTDALMAVGHNLTHSLTHWVTENAGGVLSKLLIFAGIIFLFKYLSGLVRKIMTRIVRAPQSKLSTLVQEFIISMSGKAVMLFGILIALAQVGLNLGPLLTGLGVAGIVIGFALQDTLSNFASGMMILIYRPFDVEDFVEAGGVSGMVSHMSLVNTTIRTFDNQIFIVPNSQIWSSTIKNITAEKVRRVDMVFGIGYSDDIEKTELVLADILKQHSKVLNSPEPTIKVMTLNESSVDFIVRPWVKTADYWEVYWDITKTVKMRFDQEGISIPFPQRDVHLYETK